MRASRADLSLGTGLKCVTCAAQGHGCPEVSTARLRRLNAANAVQVAPAAVSAVKLFVEATLAIEDEGEMEVSREVPAYGLRARANGA